MSDHPVPPQRGDEHELFERYAERLQKATRLAIRTTPEIVDDACAFAWMKLVENQPRREMLFAWLRAVARNKALELDRLARYHASRQMSLHYGDGAEAPLPARRGSTELADGLMELRERLEQLPSRQRELVFLHAAGWRYKELAAHLGVSETRVDQLLARARLQLREMDLNEFNVQSPRGRRLREIENEPPSYIVAAIGRQPRADRRTGAEGVRREWKRLALEIEDYRVANDITDPVLPLGRGDHGPRRDALSRRIVGYRRQRGLSIDIGR